MASMKEIAEKADEIFKDTYSVHDILVGNTIEMHQECWDVANHMLKLEEENEKTKVFGLYRRE